MIKELTEIQKAYIAGFFDGEGCISISTVFKNGKEHNTLFVSIDNTDFKTLTYIHKMLGMGKWENYPDSRKPNYKRKYRIYFKRHEAQIFLKEILPYIFNRKEEAELIIELLSIRRGHRWNKLTKEELILKEVILQEIKEVQQNRKSGV